MRDKIKVSNRTNNLAEGGITITRDGSTKIIFTSTEIAVAKRYLKYLSKKFLKKHQLKEYLRVVATDKSTYTIKYFKVGDEEEEADE